jgi:uncharacterized protein involved in outer membrane biogenesis
MAMSKRARGILWIILAVLVAIPILIVLVALLKLDALVQAGVQIGGSKVLGVRTQVEGASASLLGGKLALTGLNVANPPGFKNDFFVKANLISVSAQVSGLMKKEIHLYEVILESPEFSYEVPSIGGKTNVDVIMDNIKSGEKAPPKNEQKGEQTKLKIDLLSVTNARVHVVYLGAPINITLPKIEMRNLDDGHGNAIPTDQVLSALLRKITGGITDQIAGLGKGSLDLVSKNAKQAGEVGEKAGQGVVQQGEKAVGAIKGLFGK